DGVGLRVAMLVLVFMKPVAVLVLVGRLLDRVMIGPRRAAVLIQQGALGDLVVIVAVDADGLRLFLVVVRIVRIGLIAAVHALAVVQAVDQLMAEGVA